MSEKELSRRQQQVLRGIVRSHIEKASPVGSRHLVKRYGLNCSPATIRNDMADLEEMAYIAQPHTSAGRIPTDKGYRFYVDSLMEYEGMSPQERQRIRGRMEQSQGDVYLILEETSRILGKNTKELCVVITPWLSHGIFDRLELIGLSERKILVVIHVRCRLVKTLVMEMETDVPQEDLEETTSVFNERLSGLSLEEIQTTIKERIQGTGRGNRMLMRRIAESAGSFFDFSLPAKVHYGGTQDILTQPEFSDAEMLRHVLALMENREVVMRLFRRKINRTEVTIGRENNDSRLQKFSVIQSSYNLGKDVGTLGVIGPTRMYYGKILPLVDCVAKMMSQFLS